MQLLTMIAATTSALVALAAPQSLAAKTKDCTLEASWNPTTADVTFSLDADSAANDYLRENSCGFAVAIRVGGETQVPLHVIRNVLDCDLRSGGIKNAVFFFERGKPDAGSSVVMVTSTQVFGPLGLAAARLAAPDAATQHLFELQNSLID